MSGARSSKAKAAPVDRLASVIQLYDVVYLDAPPATKCSTDYWVASRYGGRT